MKDGVTEIVSSDRVLTPAERIEALMDAFARYQSLERARNDIKLHLENDPVRTSLRERIMEHYDAAVIAEIKSRDEIVAHVKILMGNGVLDHAADLLRADPGGRD
jgi:hypothetical protein